MSNIRDTDLVLVSRSGTPYDCPASELSNRLRDGDYLLVSRSGTPYKVSGSNIDNIRDNDTLLISRGSTPYKVTGADFKTLLGPNYPSKADAFAQFTYFGNASQTNYWQRQGIPVNIVTYNSRRHSVIIKSSDYGGPFTLAGGSDSQSWMASPGWVSDHRLPSHYFDIDGIEVDVLGGPSDSTNAVVHTNHAGITYTATQLGYGEGFHDWQVYSGNGSSQRIYHNLKETPGAVMLMETNRSFSGVDIRYAGYSIWHHKSPNHVHVVQPINGESNQDNSTSGSIIYTSNQPIYNVTDEYIDVRSTSSLDFTNRSGINYVLLIFGGHTNTKDTSLIKCGQYTGSGNSNKTLTMGFAPSFFLSWIATDYPSSSGTWAGSRICSMKEDNYYPQWGYLWDGFSQADTLNMSVYKHINSWNSNGVTLCGSCGNSYTGAWNKSNVVYNYIAI